MERSEESLVCLVMSFSRDCLRESRVLWVDEMRVRRKVISASSEGVGLAGGGIFWIFWMGASGRNGCWGLS